MSVASEPMDRGRAGSLALSYALRELRGGLRGFYVFIACIALGVMAIAGVGSVSARLCCSFGSRARSYSSDLGARMNFHLPSRTLRKSLQP